MDTLQGNKLIETFRGERELAPSGKMFGKKRGYPKEHENWYDIVLVDDLKYHTSWDWLMPVVKKIASLGYIVEIVTEKSYEATRIYAMKNSHSCGLISNDTAWLSVVQFIQWHNVHTRNNEK